MKRNHPSNIRPRSHQAWQMLYYLVDGVVSTVNQFCTKPKKIYTILFNTDEEGKERERDQMKVLINMISVNA